MSTAHDDADTSDPAQASPTLGWFGVISIALADKLGIAPQGVSSTLAILLVSLLALLSIPLAKRYAQHTHKFAHFARLTVLIVGYSLCNGFLLILNKVAVTHIPLPSVLLFSQLLTAAVSVKALTVTGTVQSEPLQWQKAKHFVVIVAGFVATLSTNVHALEHVPVDTIICFRSSAPLVVAVIEYLYLGRAWPSLRSWVALIGVFLGVSFYALHDIHFTIVGYTWVAAWYTVAVFEMVWVKKVINSVPMSNWGRTYYTNVLGLVPFLVIAALTGELHAVRLYFLQDVRYPAAGLWAFWLSCAAGVGMSYFSYALREAISATSFSIVGNLCKVLTILANLLLLPGQHSDAKGTVALFMCMLMAALYQQPPMRPDAAKLVEISVNKPEDAQKPLKTNVKQ